jgi:lipoic acid synthetase
MKNDSISKPKIKLSHLHEMKRVLRDSSIHTVCEEANCPNISTCFSKSVATVLLMGSLCTRGCRFCNIQNGAPGPLDPNEPQNVVQLSKKLKLQHIVLTSVTRDDLDDGGAKHYALTIKALRSEIPEMTVEVLTPDFRGVTKDLQKVLDEDIVVFNHNVEMVPRLYKSIRVGSDFERSLSVLKYAKKYSSKYKVKSGFMLGLGEQKEEVRDLISSLRDCGVDILTLGQYLNPSQKHAEKVKSYTDDEFAEFDEMARKIGIKDVFSGAFVRSSFNASEFI